MTFRLFCLSRIPCNSSSWLCKGCKQEAMALCACHLANCRMNSTSSSENITNKCREKPPDLQRNFSGGKGTYPALEGTGVAEAVLFFFHPFPLVPSWLQDLLPGGAGSSLGDEVCSSPLPRVPWGEAAAHTLTLRRRKKFTKKEEKKKKKAVNNLRDKASAAKPNLFQVPAAGFGHLD